MGHSSNNQVASWGWMAWMRILYRQSESRWRPYKTN